MKTITEKEMEKARKDAAEQFAFEFELSLEEADLE